MKWVTSQASTNSLLQVVRPPQHAQKVIRQDGNVVSTTPSRHVAGMETEKSFFSGGSDARMTDRLKGTRRLQIISGEKDQEQNKSANNEHAFLIVPYSHPCVRRPEKHGRKRPQLNFREPENKKPRNIGSKSHSPVSASESIVQSPRPTHSTRGVK